MIEICEHDECTGCAACRDACPKRCISMVADELDALHPHIDENVCIDCKLCQKTCPDNKEQKFSTPKKVWAAWSNDKKVRHTSASGGIACELYRYWLSIGGVAAGVIYERKNGCHFVLIENESILEEVQNSKYTFSDTKGIYKVVKEKLQANIPVLFVGVPCQVAGLYGFLKKDYSNLTTIDIICHGMPPSAYLEQHISSIEKKKKEHAKRLSFRDPRYHTYTFTFTLYNIVSKLFYKKKVLDTDNYQLGYHRALIYRENCYQCHYARKERIGDLTLGDFSGLGRLAPFEHDRHNVSCILQNTYKGAALLAAVEGEGRIYKEERPKEEAFKYEKQLIAPSVKHVERDLFETEYRKNKNFEQASNVSLSQEKRKALQAKYTVVLKTVVRTLVPNTLIQSVRKILKGQKL